MASQELPHVELLRLQPGDVVVLSYGRPLMRQQHEEILARAAANFPGHKVLVLDDGATLSVARKEDIDG